MIQLENMQIFIPPISNILFVDMPFRDLDTLVELPLKLQWYVRIPAVPLITTDCLITTKRPQSCGIRESYFWFADILLCISNLSSSFLFSSWSCGWRCFWLRLGRAPGATVGLRNRGRQIFQGFISAWLILGLVNYSF